MDYSKIRLSQDGATAVVTLADPSSLNAASRAMVDELLDACRRIASGELGARAVLLTGEGRGFCSGASLSEPGVEFGEAFDAGAALDSHHNPLVRALRALPVPLVTAVNGAAAGVGCAYALMGDLVVAADSAYFLQAFRRIGLVPDGGSTWLLPRVIGKARAMEMMLLGEKLPAATALEWGLVNRVVPDAELMPTALALARQLAEGPASLGATRRLVWEGLEADWDEQLEAERRAQLDAGRTQDFIEGIQGFFQKRPAKFSGR